MDYGAVLPPSLMVFLVVLEYRPQKDIPLPLTVKGVVCEPFLGIDRQSKTQMQGPVFLKKHRH